MKRESVTLVFAEDAAGYAASLQRSLEEAGAEVGIRITPSGGAAPTLRFAGRTEEGSTGPVIRLAHSSQAAGPDQPPDEQERDLSRKRTASQALRESEEKFLQANRRWESMVEQRDRQLAESEQRFHLMAANVKDYAIIFLDVDGRVVGWNAGAERCRGYKAAEIIGKHFSCLYSKQDIERGLPAIVLETAAREGRFEQEEGERVRKDGTTFYANVVITALRDEAGTLRGFCKVTRDITERKRAQQALRESESLFHALAELSPVGIFRVSVTGESVYVNDRFCQMSGRSVPEVMGSRWTRAIHPDDRERIARAFSGVHARRPLREEYRLQKPDGAVTWVICEARWVGPSGALPEGILGTLTDMTALKASEIALRESEQQYQRVVWNINEAIFVGDAQGRLVFANQHFFEMFAIPPEKCELIRMEDCIAPEGRLLLSERRGRLMRGEQVPEPLQLRGLRADGGSLWLEASLAPIEHDGQFAGVQAMLRDITDQRLTEETLQWLSTGLAHASGPEFFNQVSLQLSRLLETEIGFVGKLLPDREHVRTLGLFVDGQAAPAMEYALAQTPCGEAGGRKVAIFADHVAELFPEFRRLAEMGIHGYAAAPLFDSTGKHIGLVGVMSRRPLSRLNTIERVLNLFAVRVGAEIQRQGGEARFHNLFEFATDAILLTDRQGAIVLANRRAETLFGYSAAELTGMPVENLVPVDQRPEHARRTQEFFGDARSREMGRAVPSLRALRKDGTTVPVEIGLSVFESDEGMLAVAAVRDVTERKQAEQLLRRQAQIADQINEAIVCTDLEGRITNWNQGAERMFGYTAEEAVGLHVAFLYPEEGREFLWREVIGQYRTEGRNEVEVTQVTRSGVPLTVLLSLSFLRDESGRLTGVVGCSTDITEHRRMEALLLQSQKIESLGRLAGGVAHDFNNLLTVINGYSRILLGKLKPGDPLRPHVENILQAGDRAAGLTQQLLAFSRKQVRKPELLDVNQAVAGMQPMLTRLVGEDVKIELALGADIGKVHADPHQLDQVLMNLVVNARDAMPLGGRLLIETTHVEQDRGNTPPHPEARPGRYVVLTVSDTGTGMDAQMQQNIFEPFFTTRKVGEGTGLGLSIVQGIVAQSGGYVTVYSELGHGSTFKVYLPLAEARMDAESGAPAGALAETQPAPPQTSRATVLLVEDQREVREYVAEVLEAHRYHVLQADSAAAAVSICRTGTTPIDLVLTDVVMPDVSGLNLAEELVRIRPGLHVLFMSGYADNVVLRHGILSGSVNFIEKPFSPGELLAKIQEVLISGNL